MRPFKVFAASLFLLLLCVSSLAACGLFRGRTAGPGRRSRPQAEMVMQAQNGCGCCASCDCDADNCGCNLGKEPCSPECRCLLQAGPAVDPLQFPGVVQERMHQHGERYTINGKSASRRDVILALTTVPDDRKELSLSFLGGSDAERAEAVQTAKEIGLDKLTLIQSYPADSPIIKNHGFVTPATYLETPTGKVLLRSPKWDKATLLSFAEVAQTYNPANDPTPNSFPAWLTNLEKEVAQVPVWAWFLAGLGVVVLLNMKKAGTK